MTLTGGLFCLFAILALAGLAAGAPEETLPEPGKRLEKAQVLRLARVALKGITREYPNKPGDVLSSAADVRSPRETHPAFYGCFDWHSAVHGHWMLVRLLRLYPDMPELRKEAVTAISENLTAENIRTETAYFDVAINRHFERTYGWAWLLRLALELQAFDDDLGRAWARNLAPLEKRLVELSKAYLPKLQIPIRSGEHRDTAFGLAFFLDYARAVQDTQFERLLLERARTYFGRDEDYPERYEPSGHDFFSAALNEADLMRRVLPPHEFAAWLDRFLPGVRDNSLHALSKPASVTDVTDGKLVHLAGLNLTRAWTMRSIASVLPAQDARRTYLTRLSNTHAKAGCGYVFTGHYAGEHWLASFAVYLLTDAGLE